MEAEEAEAVPQRPLRRWLEALKTRLEKEAPPHVSLPFELINPLLISFVAVEVLDAFVAYAYVALLLALSKHTESLQILSRSDVPWMDAIAAHIQHKAEQQEQQEQKEQKEQQEQD